MALKQSRELGRAGGLHSRLKAQAAVIFARVGPALTRALESLRPFGASPASTDSSHRPGQFPSLASAEREYRALLQNAEAAAPEPFPPGDPAERVVVPARRPSECRDYVGH